MAKTVEMAKTIGGFAFPIVGDKNMLEILRGIFTDPLCLFLFVIIVLYRLSVAPHKHFKKLGVRGPRPLPIIGNLKEVYQKAFHLAEQEFITKYGKICGWFFGRRPVLLVADPEMIKQICVQEYDKFHERAAAKLLFLPPRWRKMIGLTRGKDWKRIRQTLSPSFSSAKIRSLTPTIEESTERLIKILDEYCVRKENVDVKRVYGNFALEIILCSSFGISLDLQNNPNHRLARATRNFFKPKPVQVLPNLFPLVGYFLDWMPYFTEGFDAEFIVKTATDIIAQRRSGTGEQRKDLLNILLTASVVESDGRKAGKLSEEEIVAQSIGFMLAGFDGTSTSLASICFLLAMNPEEQEKVYQEIQAKLPKDKFPTQEEMNELDYLDKVMLETLRMCPPALSFGRVCQESCTVNGMEISKGQIVTFPVYCLHRIPEFWPEPDKFDPSRFTPEAKAERDPYTYLPFGAGPKTCIGKRMALMEVKLVSACVLRKFKFEACSDLKEIPMFHAGSGGISGTTLELRIVPRE